MNVRTNLFSDFRMSSWIGSLCAAILGLWMFAGCDHRHEPKQPWPQTDSELSEPVDSSAEPLEPRIDIQVSEQTLKPEPMKPRSDDDPTMACLSVSQEKSIIGEIFELTVVLSLEPGYEISSLTASPAKIPTKLELKLPPGFSALEDWRSPEPMRSFNPGAGSVYLGETSFLRKIHIATDVEPGDYLLVCSVSYQVCNSRQCLRPIKALLSVKMSVSR
jgi:hypothetical protein